jgi:hypothetical protein
MQTPQSNKGQQNYVRGCVNHVAAETAQEAQDIVIGIFLVNFAPASVLFDSRRIAFFYFCSVCCKTWHSRAFYVESHAS